MFLRDFRSDWTDYTDEQITEAVKYLQKWYRLYHESIIGGGYVSVGDVSIGAGRFNQNAGDNEIYYMIGGTGAVAKRTNQNFSARVAVFVL